MLKISVNSVHQKSHLTCFQVSRSLQSSLDCMFSFNRLNIFRSVDNAMQKYLPNVIETYLVNHLVDEASFEVSKSLDNFVVFFRSGNG